MSYCPNCGHKQICDCKHCTKRRGPIKRFFQWLGFIKPWYWPDEAELIACGKCHMTANAAWWSDLDVTVLCLSHGVKTLTEVVEIQMKEREAAGGNPV